MPLQAKGLTVPAYNFSRSPHNESAKLNDSGASDVESQFFTPEELVRRWRHSLDVRTLANWRAAEPKMGPPFCRIGRAILYPRDLLEKWERRNLELCGLAQSSISPDREQE